MFLNEDAFKKNSLFGSFESQIKRGEYKQREESTFGLLNFLRASDNDVSWYHDLTDKIIDKEYKFKGWKQAPFPQTRPRLGSASRESPFSSRASQHSNEGEAMSIDTQLTPAEETHQFTYAPRSPSPPPPPARPSEQIIAKAATRLPEKPKATSPAKVIPLQKTPVAEEPVVVPKVGNITPAKPLIIPTEPKTTRTYKSPVRRTLQQQAQPETVREPEEKRQESIEQAEEAPQPMEPTQPMEPDLPAQEQAQGGPRGGYKNPRGRPPQQPMDNIPYPWQHNKKAMNIMKNWYPLSFKLPYPFPSQLNSAEQRDYIDLHKQFTAIQREHHGQQTIQLEGRRAKLYRKYMHYKNLLGKEYFNFEKYSKAYYRRAIYDDYAKLDVNVEKYMQELCAFLHQHIKSSYAPLYRRFDEFSLTRVHAPGTPQEPNANLKFESNLIRLGNVNKIIFPNVTTDRQAPVTLSYTEVNRRSAVYENVIQDGVKRTEKIYFMKPPLHADKNVEKLVLKYKVDIVMCNSSFINLMFELSGSPADAKPFDPKVYNESEEYAREEFRLPLLVKTLRSPDGKESQRCLFIEKPFLPTHLSKREVNEKYYKRALMATFIKTVSAQQNKEAVLAMRKAKNDSSLGETIVKDDDDYVDHNLLSNLEASIAKSVLQSHVSNESVEPVVPKTPNEPEASSQSLETPKEPEMVIDSPDSPESESEAKKLKIDVDEEDYQYYDESEEEEKLMIVDTNQNEAKQQTSTIDETPTSPPHDAEIASPDRSPVRKVEEQSTAGHYNLRNRRGNKPEEAPAVQASIKPKVIPLDKVAGQESEVKEAETTPKEPKKPEAASEPSLFELIYKMQEKLTSAQASIMAQESSSTEVTTFHQPATRSLFNYVNKTQSQEMVENPKDYSYVPNKHENVSYSLWTLNTNPPLRILVRSSVDGYINEETSSHNKVVIHPKLEYQPQFGCERLSKRDYCKMWCKSFLRLGCSVVLCRINVFMNKIGSISNYKNQDILPANCSFNPQQALNQMRDLFRRLMNLKENSYLLEKRDMKGIQILESVGPNMPSNFDLNRQYSFQSRWDKNPLWLPIDPSLYLPYHHVLNRIPSTFEPEEVKQTSSPQAGDQAGAKKKRKRSAPKSRN